MSPRNDRTFAPRRGVVLFMVVAIVLMMTLLTYAFLLSMRTQSLAASQAGDQLQARQAAFSARELMIGYMEDSLQRRHSLGGMSLNDNRLQDIRLLPQGEELDEFVPRGAVLAGLRDFRPGVQNESGKINLTRLLEIDEQIPGWGRQCLLRLPQMTETIADHILDWIDEDDEPREFGAESEFYLEEFGWPPRNAIPASLDDFRHVPDVTRELLFGNSADERNESARDGEQRDQEESVPWSEFLTVYSAERNETYEGNPRISLNDKDLFQLHSSLTELVNIETANFVVLARQNGLSMSGVPGNSSTTAGESQVRSPGEYPIDFTIAPEFEFASVLDIVGGVVKIGDESENPDNVIYVGSPFGTDAALDDLLDSFLDGTTINASQVLRGNVNIMLAPREVLLSVPGIGDELAEQIITNRDTVRNQAKNSFWLLENRLVNIEQMKSIADHVTVRGEVCRFVYAGWSHSSLAPVAFRTLVDASGESAVLISNQKITNTEFLSRNIATLQRDR